MEGTRILDRARHDMSAPQSTPLDEQSRAVNGADAPGNSTDLQGAVQGYGAAPLSEAPKGSFEDVYYLGVHNNRVAVFVGPPEDGRVLRVIERRLDTLPPREVTLLQQGIRVEGESEMLKALEGTCNKCLAASNIQCPAVASTSAKATHDTYRQAMRPQPVCGGCGLKGAIIYV